MKTTARHSAFSLLEVLFAMMVLTLGMIFVAAQFPIGLSLAKSNADQTQAVINAHNTAALLQTKIQAEISLATNPTLIGDDTDYLLNVGTNYDNNPVNYLYQTNIRIDYNDTIDLVIDDPTGDAFPITPTLNLDYVDYLNNNPIGLHFPFDRNNNTFISLDTAVNNDGQPYAENLGKIMIPQVDQNNPKVRQYIKDIYGYDESHFINNNVTATEWQDAIYDITTQQTNYSSASLYMCVNQNTNLFRFYIFIFSNPNPNLRYAAQNNITMPSLLAAPLDHTEDRKFPIPWLIDFDQFGVLPIPVTANDEFNIQAETGITNAQEDDLLAILRPGTTIVDARYGYVYEIMDLEQDNNNLIYIRLRQPLLDDLHAFWLFPPPIERTGTGAGDYEFADTQPVIKMIQKTVKFN